MAATSREEQTGNPQFYTHEIGHRDIVVILEELHRRVVAGPVMAPVENTISDSGDRVHGNTPGEGGVPLLGGRRHTFSRREGVRIPLPG